MRKRHILDNETKAKIVKQKYLFRGTIDARYDRRNPFFFGVNLANVKGREYVTSVTNDLFRAMVCGCNRLESDRGYYPAGAKPVLLAINADNYIDNIMFGLEPFEFEIIGKINHNDIILLDSREKLLEIYPEANKEFNRFQMDFFVKEYCSLKTD